MTRFSSVARHPAVIGGVIGLLAFAADAVGTLFRFILNPLVAERATGESFVAMLAFLFLFVAAGALAGCLWFIQIRLLRFLAIGAIVGALVWSYMTLTWPLTARVTAVVPPQTTVPSAILVGAAGGALGGALLLVIGEIRRLLREYWK